MYIKVIGFIARLSTNRCKRNISELTTCYKTHKINMTAGDINISEKFVV